MTLAISFPELFAFALSCKSERQKMLRRLALQRFKAYVGRDSLSMNELNKEFIDDYLSWMVKCGTSPKTIELYRNELRATLVAAYPDAEGVIKRAFVKSPTRRGATMRGLTVEQLRLLTKVEFGDREDLTQARDFFMFCVYCGGLDYNAAKSLTKAEVGERYLTLPSGIKVTLNLNIQALISKYDVTDVDALFPFCKSTNEAAYVGKLREIGVRLHLPHLKDHHAEAKAWLSVARTVQVDIAVMAACAYKRVDCLTHYTGEAASDQKQIDCAFSSVCLLVVDNNEHWYAMKLRDKVTPAVVLQLLHDNEKYPALRQLTTYYPMEEIKVRLSNGQWKQNSKAFIKDVLFFRTMERFVNPLFLIVRNAAWIFRQSNSPASPYAVISQREMENFQRAISQFTDDIAVSIVENSDIAVGKRVRLEYGDFAGCEGIIEGEECNSDTPELRDFYIRFTSNNSFKFQIKVCEGMLTVLD
jgi:hypothetical protein